ncbi:MAG: GNAT family N-acetyltransferase [Desulfosporosinus sp.]|nr:GNAT family N-acetyltransferase [Desulfosporosinus sp.]
METQKGIIEFSFITRESTLYSQAVELRYKIFFAPLNISMDAVFDNLEEQSIHLVAHIGDTTLGYARLTIEKNLGQISQMVVDSFNREKGIGAELIKILIDKFVDMGVYDIFLNARVSALGFYKKLGFISVGQDFPSEKTGLPHRRMEKIIVR